MSDSIFPKFILAGYGTGATTDTLFAAIQANEQELITAMFNSIQADRQLITYYEKQVKEAEIAYDLNLAAQIKFGSLEELQHKITKSKAVLLKAITDSACKTVKNL